MSLEKNCLHDLNIYKTGSNALADFSGQGLDSKTFRGIGEQVLNLGGNSLVVTSGAAMAGAMLEGRRLSTATGATDRQYFASNGQREIERQWEDVFGAEQIDSMLMRRDTFEQSLGAITCSLARGIIPVVNGDYAADDGNRYDDNDTLAASLAVAFSGMFRTVRLFLMTDQAGVLKKVGDDSTRIPVVASAADVQEFIASGNNNGSGGGLDEKIRAAMSASDAGVLVYILDGRDPKGVERAINGDSGTQVITKLSHYALQTSQQQNPELSARFRAEAARI